MTGEMTDRHLARTPCRSFLWSAALAAALLVGGKPTALCAQDAPPDGIEIALLSPVGDAPLFGEQPVKLGVYPPNAPIERVEVFLDDVFIAADEEFPYEISVDFGEKNIGHDVLVVIRGEGGWTVERRVSTPSIRSNDEVKIKLQQLYVTVERDGEPEKGLDREAFQVLDKGATQQLVTFERGDVPFTAILLVDASISMRGVALEKAVRGAKEFAANMNPLDEAMLMLFSDRTIYETPFTSFSSVLSLGLGGAEAAGFTALNDYLYLSLKRLEDRQGRRVIILLSDGFDVNSVLGIEQVREIARVNPTVIHWVYLRDPGNDLSGKRSFWRSHKEQIREAEILRETVLESGGKITPIERIDQVSEAFQEILSELRDQYVLGYYPPAGSRVGDWRDIRVDVNAPGVETRTRSGYYVAPEE